jgi:Ca-activated chloride channel family protein
MVRKTTIALLAATSLIACSKKLGMMDSARPIGAVAEEAPAQKASARQPEAEKPNTERYEDHGVNPWTDTTEDPLSTFAIDVDTGSYAIARKKLLQQNALPPAESVRVEEFVNYFRYDYPNPDGDLPFGVHVEAAPSPFTAEPNRYLARIGVQGKRLQAKERKPIHLTFLVDVSGSMNAPDKLPLAVESLKILTNNLQPGDTVALVTYAGHTAKLLDPTGLENKGAILEALYGLGAGGGTGMSDGMKTAYELAISQKKPGHVSRVIVLSDGDANIGPSSHDEILEQIQAYVDEGVTMSTIGLGMGNYKDDTMEQLANKGNGNYYYIDSIEEARKVFGEQLDGTLQVIAKDVKLQVEFDPEQVSRYRLIGYENRDIADEDFRDDSVDAGEIGAGHTVTALYELELAGKPASELGTVRVRHKKPDAIKATEDAFAIQGASFRAKFAEASKDFQFASAVAAFAEVLRESPHASELNYDWVLEVAQAGTSPGDVARKEFLTLVEKANALSK